MNYTVYLYKVYTKNEYDSNIDVFENTDVLNEHDFKEFFREQVKAGYIDPENLKNHGVNVQGNPQDVDIDIVIDCLLNNVDYVGINNNVYFVEQIAVNASDNDIYD